MTFQIEELSFGKELNLLLLFLIILCFYNLQYNLDPNLILGLIHHYYLYNYNYLLYYRYYYLLQFYHLYLYLFYQKNILHLNHLNFFCLIVRNNNLFIFSSASSTSYSLISYSCILYLFLKFISLFI